MKSIADIIRNKGLKRDYRNSYEYQAYGNRLAEEFSDMKHRALYIKLAKSEKRNLLERAREYVLSSEKATTKGKLFMWKLTQLKKDPATLNKADK
jgi:Zn-finger domain-containing protein